PRATAHPHPPRPGLLPEHTPRPPAIMSLTNRFSALLLITLGLTLAGFSTALMVSTRIYLDRQIDHRLTAILDLLKSSADTKKGWVRWDAREKRLPPSRSDGHDASTWLVDEAA